MPEDDLAPSRNLPASRTHLYNPDQTIGWSARRMKPLPSHFDGKRFHNPVPRRNQFAAVLRWMASRKPGKWSRRTDVAPGPRPPTTSQPLRVTFVNHATLLLQFQGINMLTDPIWSKR